MKKENGLSQLSNNLKEHKNFKLYNNDGLFAEFKYDEQLKRYQSEWGYLTIEGVFEIIRDLEDERYVIWEN